MKYAETQSNSSSCYSLVHRTCIVKRDRTSPGGVRYTMVRESGDESFRCNVQLTCKSRGTTATVGSHLLLAKPNARHDRVPYKCLFSQSFPLNLIHPYQPYQPFFQPNPWEKCFKGNQLDHLRAPLRVSPNSSLSNNFFN